MARPGKTERVLFAQERNAEFLMALPNVLGVATGLRIRAGKLTEEVCIQVFVHRKLPVARLATWERVPGTVLGYEDEAVRCDVIEVSLPEAHQDTARYRPVPGGSSIGPESSVSAGTLGGWACDNDDDTVVLLSNNHVISNLDTQPAARRIVQPGRLDGGVLPGDVIGQLKRDVPLATIPFGPTPPNPPVTAVDAAIGTIEVGRTDQVLQAGPAIYEVQAPAVNMNVQKRGRTTRLTTNGRVTSVNGTFNVSYRNRTRLGRVANTFVITSTDGNVFSAPGDSGSLIFNQQRGVLQGTLPVVGLLYAGGTFGDGTPFTLACDINAVFGALNLTTICNCAVRALLRAILEGVRTERGAAREAVRVKEAQLRRLRAEVLPRTALGKQVEEFVTRNAASLAAAILEDEETFAMATAALEPWVGKPTTVELLESTVDAETVERLSRLAERVGRRAPELRPHLSAMAGALKRITGMKVADALRAGAVELPSPRQAKRRRR